MLSSGHPPGRSQQQQQQQQQQSQQGREEKKAEEPQWCEVPPVEPDPDVPGHQLRHQPAAEVHPGQRQVRDPQGNSVRQHPGEVQQDEGPGRGGAD